MLSAHGGVGKSFIGAELAVCLAAGIPWFGAGIKRSRVVLFSAEDDERVLHERLRKICHKHRIDLGSLAGWLFTYDMTSVDPELFGQAGQGREVGVLPRYNWLKSSIGGFEADVVIIDNASDTFAGKEIARSEVRAFIRSLRGLMGDTGSVLLLTHTSKEATKSRYKPESADSDESYSGSTAWHNSARCRWSLRPTGKDGGVELSCPKSNWGPKPASIMLTFDAMTKTFIPLGSSELGDLDLIDQFAETSESKAILRLMVDFNDRGEAISPSTSSRSNAHKMLSTDKAYPASLSRDRLTELVRELERRKYIARTEVKTPDRKMKAIWLVTDAGREHCGAPTALTAQSSEDGADRAAGREMAAPSAPTGAGGVGGERAHKTRRSSRHPAHASEIVEAVAGPPAGSTPQISVDDGAEA